MYSVGFWLCCGWFSWGSVSGMFMRWFSVARDLAAALSYAAGLLSLWASGLFCFAGLVREPWLSLVSEWSSHMVLWCFLISKCILLGSDCVVVGFHGVLWLECLWDGFLLAPGSGCSTALCCWASVWASEQLLWASVQVLLGFWVDQFK